MNKPAYYGGGQPTSVVSPIDKYPPVDRVNPAYWNKNLSRSDIQILSFFYPDYFNFLRKEKEEKLKNSEGTYHINRFVDELDINTLAPSIDR